MSSRVFTLQVRMYTWILRLGEALILCQGSHISRGRVLLGLKPLLVLPMKWFEIDVDLI